jgi:hypothetical protein
MFAEGLPNQRGSVHFLALGCRVRGFPEFCAENNLDGFHCGVLYTGYRIAVLGQETKADPVFTGGIGRDADSQFPPIAFVGNEFALDGKIEP